MHKLNFTGWLIVLLLANFNFAIAQTNLNQPVPLDSKIKTGTLSNGLTYYIRPNTHPEKRVELRLVVNAGSVLEDDNQRGLAHFVEHMAFNGTKNFPKNKLVSYLQSEGVKFGAHVNAYTSFDKTVYMLTLPTDKSDVLNQGFQILEDWAHQISFEEEEIDKERGVVIEEWRMHLGAQQRTMDKYIPVTFQNSRYAERSPIGEKEIIETASPETIKKFYKDWYRPDLMAVVVVGDIDPDIVEKKIKEHFNKIEPAQNPKPRPSFDIPDHQETLISINSDKEAFFQNIGLVYKRPVQQFITWHDYRSYCIEIMVWSMIIDRLKEVEKSDSHPFQYPFVGFGDNIVRTKDCLNISVGADAKGVESTFKSLMTEIRRLQLYGFTTKELELCKKSALEDYENNYNEKDKTNSSHFASVLTNYFLAPFPYPNIEEMYSFKKIQIPGVTLKEVNDIIKEWLTQSNRVVIINTPDKEDVKSLTETEVKNILNEVKSSDIMPKTDVQLVSELIQQRPQPGKIIKEKHYPKVNVTEMTLSNGVKVIIKPTDFQNNEIILKGYSLGGTSGYEAKDDYAAKYIEEIIHVSGVAHLSATALEQYLADKTIYLRPTISDYKEGFYGDFTPKSTETALQLIYLYFTQPRKDKAAFETFIQQQKEIQKNFMNSPGIYFSKEVNKIMTQNHPRVTSYPSPEDFDKIDIDRVYQIYQERFADASDFTFFMTGNIDIEKIKPLLETYLGSLPVVQRKDQWKDLGIRPPQKAITKEFKKGIDSKSHVRMIFAGDAKYSSEDGYLLQSIVDVLNIKLVENLREEKSGVYGVNVYQTFDKIPYENYSLRISFTCAPENVEKLSQAVLEEINQIIQNGVSKTNLKKIKEQRKKSVEVQIKENWFWIRTMYNAYIDGKKFSTMADYQKSINQLSSKKIQKAAKAYLKSYHTFILYPEKTEEKQISD